MSTLRLLLLLLSLSWPAWAVTCDDTRQHGEARKLELISVTIDGVPSDALDVYSAHYIRIENHVDSFELDGVTRYYTFEAVIQQQNAYFEERYPVAASLSDLW